MDLNAILKKFAESHQMKQKSPEWYLIMSTTLGFSELATVLGICPFVMPEELARRKLGKQQAYITLPCIWGKLFEPFIRRYVEITTGEKIIGNDSYIRTIYGFRYSRDGYIVDGNTILLLEFKCPFTRDVSKLPVYSLPHVLSGLEVSVIASYGLLVDTIYRMCSLDQFGFYPEYDKKFHHRDYGRYDKDPIAIGIVGFFSDDDFTDIGESTEAELSAFLKNDLHIEHGYIIKDVLHQPESISDTITSRCPDKKNVAVLLWKIFNITYKH